MQFPLAINKIEVNPLHIFYFVFSIGLIPRFLSESLYETGTILILIFWIPVFVLSSELIAPKYKCKIRIKNLPKIILYTTLIYLILSVIIFFFRDNIYVEANNKYINIKRSLYLLNPILLISWLPVIDSKKRKKIFFLTLKLTIGIIACLALPNLLNWFEVGTNLRNFTSLISATFLDFFPRTTVSVDKSFFTFNNSTIEVGPGCDATPQILVSLYSSYAMYICCKIKSKVSLLIFVFISITSSFLLNSIRISVLGFYVSIQKMGYFDFWHDGLGSLFFSLILMLFTCSIYYFIWSKENPIQCDNEKA